MPNPAIARWLERSPCRLFAAIGALYVAIVLADLVIPRGHSIWIVYMVPLLMSYRHPSPRLPLYLLPLTFGLMVVGFVLSPTGIPLQISLTNRIVGSIVLAICAVLIYRQKTELVERRRVEAERELLIDKLQEALTNIKTLRGMLRICTSCQRVLDQDGQWHDLQRVVCQHTEAQFRPDLCFTCGEAMFPGFYKRAERSH